MRCSIRGHLTDAANLERNTWTSIQSTITALQAIQLVVDSALNLSSYDDNGLAGLGSDIDDLASIMSETQQILWNIQYLEGEISRLFGLDNAPDSTRGLQERLYEIRRYQFEQQAAARRFQTIQIRAIDTVKRIIRLWDRILGILGQKQGSQQMQAQLTQLQYLQQKHGVVVAAYQQARLAEMQTDPLIDESVSLINSAIMEDWPSR